MMKGFPGVEKGGQTCGADCRQKNCDVKENGVGLWQKEAGYTKQKENRP